MRHAAWWLAVVVATVAAGLAWACSDPFTVNDGTVEEGRQQYLDNKFAEAEATFNQVREELPERAELFFDLGVSQLQQDKFDDAETSFVRALETAPESLRAVMLANLGLARLKRGLAVKDEAERTQALTRAVDALTRAVLADPALEEARRNLEVALLALHPPCRKREDKLEPNDTRDKAADALKAAGEPLLLCPGNLDYYKVELQAGDRLAVSLTAEGEQPRPAPRLAVMDPGGKMAAADVEGAGTRRELKLEAAAAGTHVVKVAATDDEEHAYRLSTAVTPPCAKLPDAYERNDSRETAAAGEREKPMDFRVCPGDHDWFRFDLKQHESLLVQAKWDSFAGKLALEVTDAAGRVVAGGKVMQEQPAGERAPAAALGQKPEPANATAALLLDAPADALYFVHLAGDGPEAEVSGQLAALVRPPCPEGDDELEENDARKDALPLVAEAQGGPAGPAAPTGPQGQAPAPRQAGASEGGGKIEKLLRRCPADDDWFRLDVKKDEAQQVQIGFDHERGDLKLAVFEGEEEKPVAESDKSSPTQHGEGVGFKADADGAYFIHVTGPADATNFYTLVVQPPQGQGKDQSQPPDQQKQDDQEQDRQAEQPQEQATPLEQMMDQLDKQRRPNLEAEKALRALRNAQPPGGKVW